MDALVKEFFFQKLRNSSTNFSISKCKIGIKNVTGRKNILDSLQM